MPLIREFVISIQNFAMALAPQEVNVAKIFNECQKTTAGHQKNSVIFRRLYREVWSPCCSSSPLPQNPQKALEGLHECLKAILVQFKREPATERCIKYVVRLATHGVEKDEVPLEDEFAMGLCEWLLKMSGSRDKAVRYRVCQLVENLMNALSDEAEITDTLWDGLLNSMLERLRDKVSPPPATSHAHTIPHTGAAGPCARNCCSGTVAGSVR